MSDKIGLAAPVEKLVLVDEVVRSQTGRFQSQSLPGHLIHIVTGGAVSQWAEGRAEVLRQGTVVWYHENEPVRGEILCAPWRFITVSFLAPSLAPPPDACRVVQADAATLRLGKRLLAFWRDSSGPPLARQLHCHRTLLELIQQLSALARLNAQPQNGASLWWRIEKQLRLQIDQTHTLASIRKMSGLGERTVNRACQAATGLPPIKRIKVLRLGYARGLVQHSDLPMTEIAFRVGYSRPQEFSRDYHRDFGITPREDRSRTPSYQRIEFL